MAIPTPEKIEQFVSPALAQIGLDVEDVRVVRVGAKSQVIVLIDADERPDLDVLEQAMHEVSSALDAAEARGEADLGAQGYTLEVSTLGIDAPLTQPRHWCCNRGCITEIPLADGSAIAARVGVLSPDEESIILATSKGPKGRLKAVNQRVQLTNVARAMVQVEFSNPPAAEKDFTGLGYDDALTRLEDSK